MLKKIVLSFVLTAAALSAVEPTFDMLEPTPATIEEAKLALNPPQKGSYGYMMIGAAAPLMSLQGAFAVAPNVSFGLRSLNKSHVWDLILSSTLHPMYQTAYGQASYLYYLKQGIFLGVGVRGGAYYFTKNLRDYMKSLPKFVPNIDLPFLFGYEFGNKEDPNKSFMQIQVSAFLNVTASYGFGF